MMSIVFFMIYNALAVPLLAVLAHIGALFHPKLRLGVIGRYQTIPRIKFFLRHHKVQSPILIHCASMGEFEHIKPFIREMKKRLPESTIFVMFFSPSGFENVKQYPGVDLFTYAPFDWWLPVMRVLRLVKPVALIVAKHDVWPNQLWISSWLGIPAFLINASLPDSSARLNPALRFFQRPIYRRFQKILTISEQDKKNFAHLAKSHKVVVAGDTKYDQVLIRSEESWQKKILPPEICQNKFVFVAGSTWPEDEKYLLPTVRKLSQKQPEFLTIICPHEPTPAHLAELERGLGDLNSIRYSNIRQYNGQPVIVIDAIGILANLYACAQLAYVGGSFKQNIHNVLEPAAYGIPVLFGPVNQNSHEAQLLKAAGGGIEVTNESELLAHLKRFISDEQLRKSTGERARQVVFAHRGATQKTVETILEVLHLQRQYSGEP